MQPPTARIAACGAGAKPRQAVLACASGADRALHGSFSHKPLLTPASYAHLLTEPPAVYLLLFRRSRRRPSFRWNATPSGTPRAAAPCATGASKPSRTTCRWTRQVRSPARRAHRRQLGWFYILTASFFIRCPALGEPALRRAEKDSAEGCLLSPERGRRRRLPRESAQSCAFCGGHPWLCGSPLPPARRICVAVQERFACRTA